MKSIRSSRKEVRAAEGSVADKRPNARELKLPHEDKLPRRLAALVPVFRAARRNDLNGSIELLLTPRRRTLKRQFRFLRHDAWYNAGCYFYRLNSLREALRAFKRAYYYKPGDADTLNAIGNCYSELGDYQSAIKTFYRASRNSRDNVARYNLGNAFFDAEDFREAIRHYELIEPTAGTVRRMSNRNIQLAIERLAAKEKSRRGTK